MTGNLLQLMASGVEELYWSFSPFDTLKVKASYSEFEKHQESFEEEDYDEMNFEEWWNRDSPTHQIKRVSVTEIYV